MKREDAGDDLGYRRLGGRREMKLKVPGSEGRGNP